MDDSQNSLETLDEVSTEQLPGGSPLPPAEAKPGGPKFGLTKRTALLTVLIIVAVAAVIALNLFLTKKTVTTTKTTPVTINTQSLDNGTLTRLSAQAGPSGQTKQQLTVSPETLFKQNVEVQDNLKTDNNLEVGGNLTVHGTTTLQGAVGINSSLAVRGSLSVGGALTAPSLNVGTLGITTLTATGNLTFGGHLIPNGVTPSIRTSNAASGGSVSIDGNDTAGTVTIHVGSGTLTEGELAIINFHTAFATTPKVQLTPLNGPASALNYYATRSAGFFSIETSSLPSHGATYTFDYLVTQ